MMIRSAPGHWPFSREHSVVTAGNVILVLKIAVIAVTILLVCSLVALSKGKYRLHGRINIAFFVLTMVAVIGLEIIARFLSPDLFTNHFRDHQATDAQGAFEFFHARGRAAAIYVVYWPAAAP